MEIAFFAEEGHIGYMANYFIHKERLNLFELYADKIHICVNPYNTFTIRRDKNGQIRTSANPRALVLTRIPNELTDYLIKNPGIIKDIEFDEKKISLSEESFPLNLKVDQAGLLNKIQEEESVKLRRDFIAILKILSTPVDFPIVFDEMMVREATKGARSIFEGDPVKIPTDKILHEFQASRTPKKRSALQNFFLKLLGLT
ncbi:hypothetical protein KKC45_02600 [Patescibacteria group bacterium]|nr:hypothetical protein [Patescibacteria group bacterium]